MAASSGKHVALLRTLVINNFRLFNDSTQGNFTFCRKYLASDSKSLKSNTVTSKNSTEAAHDAEESNDFFGISSFQKTHVDDVRSFSVEELEMKFDINKKPPVEKVIDAPFGVIRIDAGNTPKLRNKIRGNERKSKKIIENRELTNPISDFSKNKSQIDQSKAIQFNSKTMSAPKISKKRVQNRTLQNNTQENQFIDDQYFAYSGSNEEKNFGFRIEKKYANSTSGIQTPDIIIPAENEKHRSRNRVDQSKMEASQNSFFDECFFPREIDVKANASLSDKLICDGDSLHENGNYFQRNLNKKSSSDLSKETQTENDIGNGNDSSDSVHLSKQNVSTTDNGQVNFFDEQYFSTTQSTTDAELSKISSRAPNITSFDAAVSESPIMKGNDSELRKINSNGNVDKITQVTRNRNIPEEFKHTGENTRSIDKKTTRIKIVPKANIVEPKSAYDLATKLQLERKYGPMRKEDKTEKATGEGIKFQKLVDSKGFRILRDQVEDLNRLPSADVVQILRNSIIYDQDDIVAINKPYGLPSHDGPGVRVSVGQLLPALTRLLDPSGKTGTLHLIHRLDKETTGVMLLARTPEVASRVHGMFHRREVMKKYWVITKGIPNPLQGVIDIPIREGEVDGKHRMVVKPEWSSDASIVLKKSKVTSSIAVTKYEVLATHGSCALVECEPETGIKHQIRVHLASGVNTPILGDHKYSHFTKLAPQRLPPDMLRHLGIRQSKVRYVAMHLHAKSIVLPEYNNGRNVFISSRLPKFFATNMNHLKLKPPKGK